MSYKIELKNGKILYPDGEDEFSKGKLDPYQKAFHGALLRRKTCEKCNYVSFPRQGDFSIGDFWGIEQHDPSWNDGKGTSLVLVNNSKAKKILEKIKSEFSRVEEVPLDWCLNKGNRVGFDSRQTHHSRDYFEWLVKRKNFKEAVNMAMEDNYDIGCVCMFNLNIGNNLTNYALYSTLSNMGYSVLMIGDPYDSDDSVQFKEKKRFSRFSSNPYEHWALHPGFQNKYSYYELNEKCEMFLVGSDQLWRGSFLKNHDYFCSLDWVRSDKYKISYATSFGTKDFDADVFSFSKESYLLSRINEISVREESGADTVQRMVGVKPKVVLDPVFLCDVNEYKKMVDKGTIRLPSKPFIGAYLLDITDNKEKILLSLSGMMCNDSYCVITDYQYPSSQGNKINLFNDATNEEWLAMIYNCDFFLTDSFHGICFSIIFKKQFAVVFDKENWRGFDRIKNVLDLFGLTDRIINDETDLNKLFANKIDYNSISSFLENKIKEDYSYLKKVISKKDLFYGDYSFFDYFKENEYILNQEIIKLKKAMSNMKNIIKKNRSDLFINSLNSKNSKAEVVLFSAGSCFNKNIEKIRQFHDIKYICDNDVTKWGTSIKGLQCISPAELKEIHNPIVIIMHDNVCISFDIAKQLMGMGITNFDNVNNWLLEIDKEN